jgi:hypothetical protein
VSAASIVVATLSTMVALKPGTSPAPVPGGVGAPPGQLAPLGVPGTELRTVTGRVESVRDASEGSVVAHVLRLREAKGATYVLFAWGPPAARAGDTVRVEASFVRTEDEPPVYRGLAKRYEVSKDPK